MRRIAIALTTNASGAASAFGDTVVGKMYAVQYQPGTIDTGATLTLTCESDSSKPLLTKATAGTANVFFYPRDLVHAVADGSALTGTSGGDRACPIVDGRIKAAVASGGNAKSGTVIVYVDD